MPEMLFVNLPVKDLAASTRFYEAIGCVKNEMFSSDESAAMVWSDTITFMLLTHAQYATFTSKPIADARATSAMLIGLSKDSREGVDAIAVAAASTSNCVRWFAVPTDHRDDDSTVRGTAGSVYCAGWNAIATPFMQ